MQAYSYKHLTSAGDDQVICAVPCVLVRIIVGKSVGSSVVQIADSTTDGDGTAIAELTGDALIGTWEFNVACVNGLTIDATNQTDITVIYSF